MYPVQLNLKNKHVVIIGGGKIAWRKFSKLVTEPCSIDVVSIEFNEAFNTIQPSNRIRLIEAAYKSEHIVDADLIIVATNHPETNNQVTQDASPTQWVNHTGNRTQSDFFNTLDIEHTGLTISISSQGQNIQRTKRYAAKIKAFLDSIEEDSNE
nr:NAD(P)-dependent oxidoreductase [Mammaliicoccus sp. Marseille-Q6498]